MTETAPVRVIAEQKRDIESLRAEIELLRGLLDEAMRDPEAPYSQDWFQRVTEALPCQE
jgi:hypothetical protein